jgi:hypothetical protein
MLVQIVFRRVHQVANPCRTALDVRPAAMPEESRRVNTVILGHQRHNVLPDAAGGGCGMQQDKGRSLRRHGKV